ncbi:hypothetical protein QVD99_006045 [Batrachochytrium dendrobatidis]|nr:hypothetical protein O5D80_006234 [Batrachochytrium dendrobatidis]KAK5667447.1 hypothetical protein QVD99_006045 [Batrachochytrium dendrobatidis]
MIRRCSLLKTCKLNTSKVSCLNSHVYPVQRLCPSFRPLATVAELPSVLKRTTREIAARACSTQLLLTRWALEASTLSETTPSSKERAQAGYAALQEALSKTTIMEHMTLNEKALLQKQFGTWDIATDIVAIQNRWESFGMLIWALCIVKEIPEPPQSFPHEQLYQATAIIPGFPNTIDMFLDYFTTGEGSKASHIISKTDFEAVVDKTEAWYWRSKAQTVLELKRGLQSDSPEITQARQKVTAGLRAVMENIEKAISQASQRALADGLISKSVNDDFCVGNNTAYKDMDDHGLRDLERMSAARLAALGWLVGIEEWDYDPSNVKFINPLGSLWKPQ